MLYKSLEEVTSIALYHKRTLEIKMLVPNTNIVNSDVQHQCHNWRTTLQNAVWRSNKFQVEKPDILCSIIIEAVAEMKYVLCVKMSKGISLLETLNTGNL